MRRDSDTCSLLREEAARWWAVLHDERPSAAEQQQFADWVAHSPERIEAYLEMAGLMHTLKSGRVRWPDTPAEELILKARASTGELIYMRESASAVPRMPSGHRRMQWAAAAAAVLCLIAGWFIRAMPREYATVFGQQRAIVLADGSHVTLNSASRILVTLQKRRRVVRLLQGEALFEVTHDAHRPFDVNIGSAVIRAIGTEFDVDRRATQTMVTVIEGRVAVVRQTNPPVPSAATPESGQAVTAPDAGQAGQLFPAPPDALILAAAEQVVITPAGTGIPEHVSNLTAATAWTQGKLMFDHRPLSEVVQEINRYTRVRIVIDSLALRRQEITGVIQLDDPDSFLSFLADIPGATLRESVDGDRVVTLHVSTANTAKRH